MIDKLEKIADSECKLTTSGSSFSTWWYMDCPHCVANKVLIGIGRDVEGALRHCENAKPGAL
jgi:hypothetical protein